MPRTFLGASSCKDTLELCSGTTVINAFQNVPQSAYPNPANLSVTWFPNGETTNALTVDKEGCYSVKIKDNLSGCYSEARLRVMYCQTNNGASSPTGSSVWSIGNGIKINFAGSTPTQPVLDGGMNSPAGSSSVLFPPIKARNSQIEGLYTNGDILKGSISAPLTSPIIDNMGGDINLSQATAILPKQSCQGCDSEYYIFYMRRVSGKNQLYYSVFDLSANAGNGALVAPFDQTTKYIPISSFSPTDKLIINHDPISGFKINAFEEGTNNVYEYHLDFLGLSKPNRINLNVTGTFSSNSTFKFSSDKDSTFLAVSNKVSGINQVLIFDYKQNEIQPTPKYVIDVGTGLPEIYGVAFSSDKSMLYVTLRGDGVSIKSQLLQFDLTSSNIAASKFVIWQTLQLLGEMQLEPDKLSKLYIAIENSRCMATVGISNNRFTSSNLNTNFNPLGFCLDVFPINIPGNLGRGITSNLLSPTNNSGGLQQSCSGTTYSYKLPEPPKCKDKNKAIIGANWSIYVGNAYSGRTSPNLVYNAAKGLIEQDPSLVREAYFSNKKSINYSYPDKSPNPKKYVIVVEVLTGCGSYFLDAEEFDIRNLKPFSLRSRVDKLYDPGDPNCLNRNITFPDAILDKVPSLSGLEYEWNTGVKTPRITVNTDGIYSYKISDKVTGCDVKGDIDLRYYAKANFIPKVAPSVCMDNPTRLLELKPIPNPASLEFLWTERGFPLGTNPSLNVTYATRYDLRVRDEYGCTFNQPYDVADKCLPVVLAPNIFTPNGDKVNDRFVPQPLNAARTEIKGVKIFNRWGELLFEVNNNNPDEQWDGTFKGKRVPQDTYVYVIEYVSTPANFPNMGIQALKGGVLVAY
jgi:gliding motility-associated-like protein